MDAPEFNEYSGAVVYRVEDIEGSGPFAGRQMCVPGMGGVLKRELPTPYGDVMDHDWSSGKPAATKSALHFNRITEYADSCCGGFHLCGVLRLEDLSLWIEGGLKTVKRVFHDGWGLSVYEPRHYFECGHQVVFGARESRLVGRIGPAMESLQQEDFRTTNMLGGKPI